MKKGDWVDTPRFLKVQIEEVFSSVTEARQNGYTEPTHYKWQHNDGFDVLGKNIDRETMQFAAVHLG